MVQVLPGCACRACTGNRPLATRPGRTQVPYATRGVTIPVRSIATAMKAMREGGGGDGLGIQPSPPDEHPNHLFSLQI